MYLITDPNIKVCRPWNSIVFQSITTCKANKKKFCTEEGKFHVKNQINFVYMYMCRPNRFKMLVFHIFSNATESN